MTKKEELVKITPTEIRVMQKYMDRIRECMSNGRVNLSQLQIAVFDTTSYLNGLKVKYGVDPFLAELNEKGEFEARPNCCRVDESEAEKLK